MKTKSKIRNFYIFSVVSLFLTACVSDYEVGSASQANGTLPTLSKTFELNTPGNLSVKTSGGSIKVYGHEGNEVHIKAFVRKNGRRIEADDSELKDILKDYEIRIEQQDSNILAHAKRINNAALWRGVSISFVVNTPLAIRSSLKTSGGSITVEALQGDQLLKTSGGSITIKGIDGRVSARTSGGAIKLSDQEGSAILKTSGGSIKVDGARGNIQGNTSGGSIRLNNIYGNAKVRTSGGGITVNGHAEHVEASTSGGSIKANITGLSKYLDLSTSGGGIQVTIPKDLGMDLDLKGNRVKIPLENFSGNAQKNRIEGSMNGGGIPVILRTSGGGITVEFR